MNPADIAKLLNDGGPWAACALALTAWVWERRENRLLQRSILELVTAQTQALVKTDSSITAVKEVLGALISRKK